MEFTLEQLNGPKNVMGYPDIPLNRFEIPRSVFDNPHSNAPKEAIAFLRLAEREGAYGRLSERTRQRLELRFLEGLSISEIAEIQDVTKQAVSQTLTMFPNMLYKQMTKDNYMGRTTISFREILGTYSDYLVYLQKTGKSVGKPPRVK